MVIRPLSTILIKPNFHVFAFFVRFLCCLFKIKTSIFWKRQFNSYCFFFLFRIVKLWKDDLRKTNKKAADSLADPLEYENLFPEFQEALQAEKV